jgi:acyl dehydratase
MHTFTSIDAVSEAAHTELGVSEWFEIDQDRINQFADATEDHQWIHVDVEAAAAGPFGGPIAHGFLTLSLLPHLFDQVAEFAFEGAKLNYGLEKVRFPAPVPVGARVRSRVSLGEVSERPSGKQVIIQHTVEIEGQPRPACVAEHVVLLVG